jgi:hypothetical protein
MPQIDRQKVGRRIRIGSWGGRLNRPPGGEGVANLMKPGWALSRTDVSQDALQQPLKGLPDGSIGQRLAARRDKEVFGSNVLIADPGVVLEGLKRTRMQGNQS